MSWFAALLRSKYNEGVVVESHTTFDHPGAGGQHVQGGRQGVAVDPLGVLVSRGLAWRKAFTRFYRTLQITF